MKITFIRHSKTAKEPKLPNPLWKLSDEGVILAEKLSRSPLVTNLTTIYTSDQTKALATTLILAENNYIPIKVIHDLTEATSITNGFIQDYAQETHYWYTVDGYRINKGETIKEALLRFNAAVASVISNHKEDAEIGIVSHCNVLSLFLAQYGTKTALEIHNTMQMPDLAILDLETKSLIKDFGND